MQEKITIARPYAQAAFEQAQEEESLALWSDMLNLLATIISDDSLQKIIDDPRVSSSQLQSLVLDVAGDALSQTGQNFVKVLVESERLGLAPEIHQLFESKKADAERTANIEIISAYELDASQEQKIVESLAERLGKSIEITKTIDSSLIGGAIIRAGDVVIDASLRGRLQELASELT